jgi:predicted RNA-binding protein YlqC (UPF0109 family)
MEEVKSKRIQAIEYLRIIITPLCVHPEQIVIEDILDERGLVLNLIASKEDLPFLIGRGGKIADALRSVLHIWGTRNIASVKLFVNRREENGQ